MVCVQCGDCGVWGNKIATNVKLDSMHEISMDITGYHGCWCLDARHCRTRALIELCCGAGGRCAPSIRDEELEIAGQLSTLPSHSSTHSNHQEHRPHWRNTG